MGMYLDKLIQEEIDRLRNIEKDPDVEIVPPAYGVQVHKCFRLLLDYFKYHGHEEKKIMARRVYVSLSSNEDVKLRSFLSDIREGAGYLIALSSENFEGMREDSIRERVDRVKNIGENIMIALDEVTGILDY